MKRILYRLLIISALLLFYFILQFPFNSLEKQQNQAQTLVFSFPLPENVLINYNISKEEEAGLEVEKIIVAGHFSAWDAENDKYKMEKTGTNRWEYRMYDFNPGENEYKYVVYLKGWSDPIWTHDVAKKKTDDSFGGYNSVYQIPNLRGLRLLINLFLFGAIVIVLLYSILEPLINWIMVLKLSFRVKLTISMLLVPLISNLAFIAYNYYEIREITKQGIIDNVNSMHILMEANGIDFHDLGSYKNIAIYQKEISKSFKNARVRIEKNSLANLQICLSDFFIADTNLNVQYVFRRDEVRVIEDNDSTSMGYDNRRRFYQAVFMDTMSGWKIDWTGDIKRRFFVIPERALEQYSDRYKKSLKFLGYNGFMFPIMIKNNLKGFYVGVVETELLGMEVRRIIIFNFILLLSVGVLLFLVYRNLGGIISRHLEELIEWTRYIIKGNFSAEKKINTHDEIEVLAEHFDAMRISLGQNMNNLKLLNLVTANLHHVTQVDDLFHVFLTFITANFGFEYNRAIVFIQENDKMAGKYAIGKLDEQELLEDFGSMSNYQSLQISAQEYMEHYKDTMQARPGKLLNVIRTIRLNRQDKSILWDVISRKAVFYVHDKSMFVNLKDKQLQSLLDLNECAFLPIYKGDSAIGVLLVDNYFKKKHIREEDINQLQIIINDFGANLENSYMIQNLEQMVQARTSELKLTYQDLKQKDLLMSTDLSIARKIQKSLLIYKPEDLTDIDFRIHYHPMSEVGGDIYDIYRKKDASIRIFLADATGHGVQAALVTMLIKSEYEKVKRKSRTPGQLLKALNSGFINNYPYLSFFFTGLVLDVDPVKHQISYAFGGHPPQFIISQEHVDTITSTGKILGLEESSKYLTRTREFHKGDKIILFTDGIFEQFNPENEEYGDERLRQTVSAMSSLSLEDIIPAIIKDVEIFRGKSPSNDDITLIGLEFKD